MEFILEAADETLSLHSGLGLIGLLLSKTNVYERLSHIHLPIINTLPFILKGDIIHSKSIPSGMIHFFIVRLILKKCHQVVRYVNE